MHLTHAHAQSRVLGWVVYSSFAIMRLLCLCLSIGIIAKIWERANGDGGSIFVVLSNTISPADPA